MTGQHDRDTRPAALWLRVSTTEQSTDNQAGLQSWAQRRGLSVAHVATVEDSAYRTDGGHGREFDAARDALLRRASRGEVRVVLVWALDRLTRRGPEDALRVVRQLAERGCEVWSDQEPWLEDTRDPAQRELLIAITGWLAQQESARRSERVKAGMARAKREGKRVGGRKAGAKDRKPRRTDGYTPEAMRRER